MHGRPHQRRVADEEGKLPRAEVLVGEEGVIVVGECAIGSPVYVGERQRKGFWCRVGVRVTGDIEVRRVDKPEGMLLGPRSFAFALGALAEGFKVVEALLEEGAHFGFLVWGPLSYRLCEVPFGGRDCVGLEEEIARPFVGDDFGLVLDVQDPDKKIGRGARSADEEEASRNLVCIGHFDVFAVSDLVWEKVPLEELAGAIEL